MTLHKRYLALFWILLFVSQLFLSPAVFARQNSGLQEDYKKALQVEKILSAMTTREKIAQLFIVAFNDNPEDKNTKEAIELISKEKVGGVIIMNSSLTPGARMINHLQSLSEIPLLVTLDGEWGVAMRFDSVIAFPRQMQMASMDNESLVFKVGAAIGEQTKRLGMTVNYAPSIDVNNNPSNPVINTRAFGENKEVVARYGIAYLRGMQSSGVAGSAKHFPGHGDTDTDSHLALPVLPFSRQRLDSLELYPFRKIIEAGTDMVMVGHLDVPSLDNSGRPSSISPRIVNDLLRVELEYNGIIITDALNMKGVSEYMPKERLPLEAYKAGSDLILMPENVKKAIDIMERAVEDGELSSHSLNIRTKKMLMLKSRLGLFESPVQIDLENLNKELNKQPYKSLVQEVAHNSMILVENKNENLPLREMTGSRVASLSLGGDKFGTEFGNQVKKYIDCDTIVLRGKYTRNDLMATLDSLSAYDHILLAIHKTDARPQRGFGIDSTEMEVLTTYAIGKKITFVYFGNPLALSYIKNVDAFESVLIAHQNTLHNNIAAVNIIFGAIGAQGRMPVTAGHYSYGHSIPTKGGIRHSYGVPLEMADGFDKLEADTHDVINSYIENQVYNGAHLVFMDGNNVVYDKVSGSMSVIKLVDMERFSSILTLIPAIMILREEGKLSLEEFEGNALLSDLLMHRYSSDGTILNEPVFDRENVSRLIGIVEQRSGVGFNEFVSDRILKPLGINEFVFKGTVVSAKVDHLVRLFSMLNAGGEYGGKRIMDQNSAYDALLFAFYYSKNNNGSNIWIDTQNKRVMIFLNDGNKENISGELLRSLFIGYVGQL
jgi:beta-glucosidase-like glycosyl hydrolase